MTDKYPFLNYRVLMTVLESENVYGATADVTQDIDLSDFIERFGNIKREIDNGDYDIGIYTFGSINLDAINLDRKFNSADDALSIFPFRRDRTKVEIEFHDRNGNTQTRFKGLINDDATRHDLRNDSVKFKVLSLDSILRQVKVGPGAVADGDLFSTAIKKILDVPEITSTLTYSASNINPALDIQIDKGEEFSNVTAKDALDDLLLAANSVLYVDNSDTVHVKGRIESATEFELFGRGDKFGRNNILEVTGYNNGVQRAFSSVKVNSDSIATSDAWVDEYGFRQKSVSFSFMNDPAKEMKISQAILDEFKVPKPELELRVRTEDVSNVDLFDLAKIGYDFKIVPDDRDSSLPMVGSVALPFNVARTSGSFRILPKVKWKVTGITERPRDLTTTLRLRQAGTEGHDGFFN